MIREGRWLMLPQGPDEGKHPAMVVSHICERDCGCSIYIGLRLDTHEATVAAKACESEHDPMMDRVTAALHDSTTDTGPAEPERPLADVCDEYLMEASP